MELNEMNADQVRAYIAAKYPEAMQSPVAVFCRQYAEAETVTEHHDELRQDAIAHAESCAVSADGWTVETLSHNIESSFPELDIDECDEIAEKALGL